MTASSAENSHPTNTRLTDQRGRQFWRSLNELADGDAYRARLAPEFPDFADRWPSGLSRRKFLSLMSASLALASWSGCAKKPEEEILPYVEMPEQLVPGQPLYFATAMPLFGYGVGLVAESHMGRPTRVEGNRHHPFSLGATDPFTQASVLTLYDPDRSQAILNNGRISAKAELQSAIGALRQRLDANNGRGFRILSGTITSPTLLAQLKRLKDAYPAMQWHHYEPVPQDADIRGCELAFGRPLQPLYDFGKAAVILSLDDDFLLAGHAPIPHARQFAQHRRASVATSRPREMNRLYVAESTATVTAAKADHRLPLAPQSMEQLLLALASRLDVNSGDEVGTVPAEVPIEWFEALVDDLIRYRFGDGESSALIVVGYNHPPHVHALAQAINAKLGAIGTTVTYIQPVVGTTATSTDSQGNASDDEALLVSPFSQLDSLRQLKEAMKQGEVDTLLVLSSNPVLTAPADWDFTDAISRVPYRMHLGMYADETAELCHWHIPESHYLECWSDVRARNGLVSIIQPLIAPLYDTWSPHQVVAELLGQANDSPYEQLRSAWRERRPDEGAAEIANDFDSQWARWLKLGVVPGTAFPAAPNVDLSSEFAERFTSARNSALATANNTHLDDSDESRGTLLQISFRPDPSIWDGRFANNGWLQELPKPLTKLTWDNALLIAPSLARELDLENEELVTVTRGARQLRLPVWIVPGQSPRVATLHLGYGRQAGGRVASGPGFNAYELRTTDAFWFGHDVRLAKTGERFPLACTQEHHLMHGRELVRAGTLSELQQHPDHPPFMHEHHLPDNPSLLPNWEYDGYKWGMVIDTTACIGCNACVVACQSENNIPVVGKEQVLMGREMHWLRIDTYYHSAADNPETAFQPLPCMHCEKAPCEVVCPVAATVHSDEGLNEMVYNRCVGTRYCSNNCPYKVRRFNFLQYSDYDTPVLKLLRNPDVTVRSRGVMEKCTYCVQRISDARIAAKKEERLIRAGEVITACQSACPAEAIQFGNLNNPREPVTEWRESPIHYKLLGELDTEPRTTFLASLTNPNPDLVPREPIHDES
ncbi:MAG: TAT-variant-translocated molybdopterin oxidoreductase [Planctomycetales bacterium]|nr:TAT-variant-translocated molybdopterin oxidoreductase [Planctomycetales bacterium]